MKINFWFLGFLSCAILGFVGSLAQEFPNMEIVGADEFAHIDLALPPDDLFDTGEAGFDLPDQMQVCQADEYGTISFESPVDDFFDTGDALFDLPDQMQVCQADETATFDFATPPDEFFDPAPDLAMLSKTPVLFVPGLLSTRVYNGLEELWPNAIKMIVDWSDNFLDDLQLTNNFISTNNNLNFKEVIKTEPTLNYSQGLMDEFAMQGYNVVEGSADQTFYTFPYDWRYGASGKYANGKTNVDLLAEKINQLARISPTGEVDLIAHSLGGLIAKKYVLDSTDPKIDKLVFVGVPNLGAPLAGRALLAGTDFGVFGLNPWELKKIAQNMPAAYDLLPSEEYFSAKGDWVRITKPTAVFGVNEIEQLDYLKTKIHLADAGLNQTATANGADFHSGVIDGQFMFDNLWKKGINSYNIVGCQSATFSNLNDWQNQDGTHNHYEFSDISAGDDTVPFESANQKLANDQNTFYAPKTKHGQMPSAQGIRQKIASIISGNGSINVDPKKIISRQDLLDNPNKCKMYGLVVDIKSPLAIKAVDQFGNTIEDVAGVGQKNEIPGASFEIIGDKKSVFLPQDDGQQYQVDLQGAGTGTGMFTLIAKRINGEQESSETIFKDVPVSPEFAAKLAVNDQINEIKIITNDNQEILPQNWFSFQGFFPPVKMEETNSGKAGRAIPLKFKLFHDQTESTDIADIEKIDFVPSVCDNAAANVIQAAAIGDTGNLRYDQTAGQFVLC